MTLHCEDDDCKAGEEGQREGDGLQVEHADDTLPMVETDGLGTGRDF